MALATRFIPHSVYLTSSSAWINQIEGTSPESGVSLIEESAGSATDREFVAARDVAPTLPIVTSDVSILSTIGMNGVAVIAGTYGPIVVYGRELPQGGLPTAIATTNHLKMTVTDGVMIPQTVSAQHNQTAKLSIMLHAILSPSAAQAAPFVFTASNAITSGAGATSKIYTTGPIKYTTSASSPAVSPRLLQGIKSISVDFGLGINKESDSGEVYPTHVGIISRMPRIEFATSDVELITEIGDGIPITLFTAYFRNVAANGQRVAAATTSHISIAGKGGVLIPVSPLAARHKSSAEARFAYVPVLDTGNSTTATNLLSISTSAAIPTS